MSGTCAISTTSRRELSSSFLFLQGKAPKEIHAILTETLACFLLGRAKDVSAPLYWAQIDTRVHVPYVRMVTLTALPRFVHLAKLCDCPYAHTHARTSPFWHVKPLRGNTAILEYIRSQTVIMEQLVVALRYKPEGRGFDSRWCHWNFSLI